MAAKLKINGMQELFGRLREMKSTRTMDTIAYRGTFGAAKDLKGEIAAQLLITHTIDEGTTYKNVAQKKMKHGGKQGYTVGFRANTRRQKNAGDNPWYWWLLEFGTRFIPARSFFRVAWARYQARAREVVLQQALNAVFKSAESATRRFRSPPRPKG
jgi:HK97 gp10 family phage protein